MQKYKHTRRVKDAGEHARDEQSKNARVTIIAKNTTDHKEYSSSQRAQRTTKSTTHRKSTAHCKSPAHHKSTAHRKSIAHCKSPAHHKSTARCKSPAHHKNTVQRKDTAQSESTAQRERTAQRKGTAQGYSAAQENSTRVQHSARAQRSARVQRMGTTLRNRTNASELQECNGSATPTPTGQSAMLSMDIVISGIRPEGLCCAASTRLDTKWKSEAETRSGTCE